MGVQKEVVRAGTGPQPSPGQTVTVHCTGYGKNRDLSQVFWSTKDAGQQPFSFQVGLGKVIKGWDEGVLGMRVGEVARLTEVAFWLLINLWFYYLLIEREKPGVWVWGGGGGEPTGRVLVDAFIALPTMLMALVGSQPGAFNQTLSCSLRLKFSVLRAEHV